MFHKIGNRRRNKNLINEIETLAEEQIEDIGKIKEEISNYFSNLYSSGELLRPKVRGLNWAPIKKEQAVWLERKFVEGEVKKAIDHCCPDKPLLQMGLSWHFFQNC